MNLALVHDYLYVYGGAERTLEQVHAIWPQAPIYTLLYVPDRFPATFARMDVRTTWVNHLPLRRRLQRLYALLQPVAFGALRVPPVDAVLSLASFGAKAVASPPGTPHLCYCFTPPRFLWGPYSGIDRRRLASPVRATLRAIDRVLRTWDRQAAARVTQFITQSAYVGARIRHIYGRESVVIPPPVDVARFSALPARDDGYFLIVSRFEAYKRIDLAIEACRRLRLPLHIVGDGVDAPRLRALAAGADTVRFLGARSDREVDAQMAGCRAFLFPGEEDFGLTAVEAQAAGKPVIAYGAGGALETVLPHVTGEFFNELSVDALETTLARFDPARYDPAAGKANAQRFAPEQFRESLRATVESLVVGGA